MPTVQADEYRKQKNIELEIVLQLGDFEGTFFYIGHSSNKAIQSVLHKTLRQRAKETHYTSLEVFFRNCIYF